MASVDFEHVEKRYAGEAAALADLCLSVADGELLAVVGPSGCGKSTLLRLLAGLETPTRGTLRIGGEVVNERSPQQRNVAMVFQDYALYPHRSVRGNLSFPLEMRRLPRDEVRRRVHEVAELLGIGALLERRPRELSGGERQRVAMGRALVREPTAFLLDEPLSNLDATLRVHVRAEIAELQRRTGTTMLYVTHDQVEAMTLGQRVAVLDRGRLQQVDAPREIYARPRNRFVAGFIGSPPMNLLPARLRVDAGAAPELEIGGQRVALPGALGAAARAAGGGPVTWGVRPEALRPVAPREGPLRARVLHVEFLGHEVLVHLVLDPGADAAGEPVLDPGADAAGGPVLVARLPQAGDLERGARVALEVDPEGVHLFGGDGDALPRATA